MYRKALALFACALALLSSVGVYAQEATALTPFTWTAPAPVPGGAYSAAYSFVVTETHREVFFRMKKNVEDASDPDLYIKKGAVPTKDDSDGRDATAASEHSVRFRTNQAVQKLSPGTYYVVAHGFNPTNTTVLFMVEPYECFNRNCGVAQGSGTCTAATGVCACSAGWSSLDNDCSIQTHTAAFGTPVTGSMAAGAVTYFTYTAAVDSYEAYVHASRSDATGFAYVLAAQGRAPTMADNDVIKPFGWGQQETTLHIHTDIMYGGPWTVALVASAYAGFNYTVKADEFFCPNNCSGHGTCDMATFTCQCEEAYASVPDCSLSATELTHQSPITLTLPSFESLFFSVKVPELFAASPVEMSITLETPTETTGYARMLLRKDGKPDGAHYDVISPEPATKKQTLYVPASSLAAGYYTLGLESYAAEPLNYTAKLAFTPHCPAKCTEHGYCDNVGKCNCYAGYIGGDCQTSAAVCKEEFGLHSKSDSNGVSVGVVFLIAVLAVVGGAIAGALLMKKKLAATGNPAARDMAPAYNELNA